MLSSKAVVIAAQFANQSISGGRWLNEKNLKAEGTELHYLLILVWILIYLSTLLL